MTEVKKTKHLDGSRCLLNRRTSSRSSIAIHWADKMMEFGIFIDWAEPMCWACGHFAMPDKYEMEFDLTRASTKECFELWDRHTYLERCHIIPRKIGGCSCHGNIVLLCKDCHKENPDTDNQETFLIWMKNKRKEPFANRRIFQLKKQLKLFDLEESFINLITLILNKSFIRFASANSVKVRGQITDASLVACLIEYRRLYTELELANQINHEIFRQEALDSLTTANRR